MTTTLTIGGLKASVQWDYENVLDAGNTVSNANFAFSKTLAQGTGAGQASKIFFEQNTTSGGGTFLAANVQAFPGTPTASSFKNYDLTALTDAFGSALAFTALRAIYLECTNDKTAVSVSIGSWGNAQPANPFITGWMNLTGTTPAMNIVVRNPGVLLLACGDATSMGTVSGTNKILQVTNNDSANQASYKVCFVGI